MLNININGLLIELGLNDILGNFAESLTYWESFNTVFGDNYNISQAQTIQNQWQNQDFSSLPQIEVISSDILGNANGAYATINNKIYLSDGFITTATSEHLSSVILEEIGHYIDAQVNNIDRVGDEGEYFSAVVRNVNLSASELTRIQTENDHAVISLGGQFIQVEQAAPIILIVNTTIDENDGSATLGAGLSLRDAVSIANKSPNTAYVIKLKSGTTYALSYVNNTTTGDRTLRTQGSITIEADRTELASIVNPISPINRISNNSLIMNDSYYGLTLNNVYISNKAGQGISNNGKLTLNNNTISGNRFGGITNSGTLTLNNSTISGNMARGGVHNSQLGTLTLNNSTISRNTHEFGAGGIVNNGTLTLTKNAISDNTGGGISNNGTATLDSNTISGNFGGGISNNGTATLDSNTISGNTAVHGGGIFNSELGTLIITNNAIYGNTAERGGGGIYNRGTLNLKNNVITGNSSNSYGGGIYNRGNWSSSSIITGNNSDRVWYIDSSGELTTIGQYYDNNLRRFVHNKVHPTFPNIYDEGGFTSLPPSTPPSADPTTPEPTLSISNGRVVVPAGADQVGLLEFDVKLSSASDKPVVVEYYTLDGNTRSIRIDPLKDFDRVYKETLVFFPGDKSEKITIKAFGSKVITDETLEIFCKDTAYRNWTSTDIGKNIDSKYEYGDLDYKDYYINKPITKTDETGFEAVGLTSDESFYLVLAKPINATVAPNNNNLLTEIATLSGGTNTTNYRDGQTLLSTLNSYTYAKGTIYDLAKPPVLAIRGTEFVKVSTDLWSDFNANGVGYNQFIGSQTEINQWLSQISHPETDLTLRPYITGYSLGGALSQWFGATYEGDLGRIVTFNSPGISPLNGINLNPSNNLGVKYYINAGDVVSMAGSTYLNGLWDLVKYSKLTSAITFEKHLVPILAPYISSTELYKPTDLTDPKTTPDKTTADLSSPAFTYLPNADG
jgi:hypothetical protein